MYPEMSHDQKGSKLCWMSFKY